VKGQIAGHAKKDLDKSGILGPATKGSWQEEGGGRKGRVGTKKVGQFTGKRAGKSQNLVRTPRIER